MRQIVTIISVLIIFTGSAACRYAPPPKPVASEMSGSVNIFKPLVGQAFNLGSAIEIQSRSVGSQGVQRVELWVNEQLVRADANPLPLANQPFVVSQSWQPNAPGRYAIQVKAYTTEQFVWLSAVMALEIKPAPVALPVTPLATLIPGPTPTALSAAKDVLPSPTPIRPTPIGVVSSGGEVMAATPTLTTTIMPTSPTPIPPPPIANNSAPSASLPVGQEFIIDNNSPEFQKTGVWYNGDGGQSYQGNCDWAPRGSGNNAYWQPNLTAAGMYEVFAWWCGDPNHDQSTEAQFIIRSALGDQKVTVNYQELAGQWHSLGQYFFQPGESNFVTVNGGFQGNIIADAVKFVYLGAESRPAIVPTASPTPVTWTNHPPSPLEQIAAGDLSSRMLVTGNRFYQYTPLINSENITLDNCRDFPRSGCNGTIQGWRVQVQHVTLVNDLVVTYHVSQDYKQMALVNPPQILRDRQRIFLTLGDSNNTLIQLDRQPQNQWRVFITKNGAPFDKTLPAEMLALLTPWLTQYNSVDVTTTSWGGWLKFYGWGPNTAFSPEDGARLDALGQQLLALQP